MANLRVDKITSTETFETTGSVQFDGSETYPPVYLIIVISPLDLMILP